MGKRFFFIIFGFIICTALVGCRSSHELKASERLTQSTEIGVEAHRLDSLCRLFTERFKFHIEFFNPNEVLPQQDNLQENPLTGSPLQSTKPTRKGAAPRSTMTSDGLTPQVVSQGFGGMGAVKSIDIEAECTQQEQSLSAADSTAVSKTESDTARQKENASEIKHDNGTVAIVSVVGALFLLVVLLIIVKKVLKR